jgi:hypothetical protein
MSILSRSLCPSDIRTKKEALGHELRGILLTLMIHVVKWTSGRIVMVIP